MALEDTVFATTADLDLKIGGRGTQRRGVDAALMRALLESGDVLSGTRRYFFSAAGDHVTSFSLELGVPDLERAKSNAQRLRGLFAECLRGAPKRSSLKRLLITQFGNLVLRLPEAHAHLEELRRKNEHALKRAFGQISGRGCRAEDARLLNTVCVIDALIAREGSAAAASRLLKRSCKLPVDPRRLCNLHSELGELARLHCQGYFASATTLMPYQWRLDTPSWFAFTSAR